MRILVASQQWFPDYAGGTARVAQATAREFAGLGHQVVAVVPKQPDENLISTEGGVEVRRTMRRSILPQTITDVYETRRSMMECGAHSFDVILTHHPLCALAGLSIKSHPPIAHVYHSSPGRESRHRRALGLGIRERGASLVLEGLLAAYEQIVLACVDRLLVLSEFSRRLAEESRPGAGGRTEVVGGGVDVNLFSPVAARDRLRHALSIGPNETLLVSVRRLVGRMGLEVLLDAVALARAVDKNMRLVVIGDGELRDSLERRSRSLALSESVDFVGRLSDDQVRAWYQAADVFVLPTVAYEGFGMVTAEAFACGTPVVGTDVGATSELLSGVDCGVVVPPGDAPAMAAAIRELAAATRGDEAMRERARQHACDRFDWRHVIKRWETALLAVAR